LRLRKALQLCNHACQASASTSSFHPGISLKLTGDKLADEAASSATTVSTIFGVRGKDDVVAGTEGALGFVGGAAQEIKSKLAIAALMGTTKADLRFTITRRKENKSMLAQLFDEYPMLLFVLEGLLALVILLTIVFWTGKGRKD
jgi:hypothetical protein